MQNKKTIWMFTFISALWRGFQRCMNICQCQRPLIEVIDGVVSNKQTSRFAAFKTTSTGTVECRRTDRRRMCMECIRKAPRWKDMATRDAWRAVKSRNYWRTLMSLIYSSYKSYNMYTSKHRAIKPRKKNVSRYAWAQTKPKWDLTTAQIGNKVNAIASCIDTWKPSENVNILSLTILNS